MDGFSDARAGLISTLREKGVTDERVLEAINTVPRHRFVPVQLAAEAYDDRALPIDGDQTISQPLIVALMSSAAQLGPGARLLEIGCGSGYAAAVASRLCFHVDTVERLPSLAEAAHALLKDLGYLNVDVHVGDGTLGWPPLAPYDAISVTAGGPRVPESLLWQLAPGGRLVMPVGDREVQRLICVTRHGRSFTETFITDVRFVPLIGREGWDGGGGLPLLQ